MSRFTIKLDMVLSLSFGSTLNRPYAHLLAVLLNSAQIFEKIFGDELIMDIMGCLECKCFSTPKVEMESSIACSCTKNLCFSNSKMMLVVFCARLQDCYSCSLLLAVSLLTC